MAGRDPNAEFEQDGEAAEGGGFDVQQLKELAGYVWRARQRRPKLAWSVFVVVASLAILGAAAIPSVYNSQVKLLAQQDLVLPALGNPGRSVPRDADNPTKNVAEMIMRQENLIALAKDADLVDRFDQTRPPALRLKDKILARLRGPLSEHDKLRGIVSILEKKISVVTDGETLTIGVDWPEPEMACDLVTLLQKNFLEAQYDTNVAIISDAMNMLQEHAKSELTQVDLALADYQKLWTEREEERAKDGAVAGPARVAVSGNVARPRVFVSSRSVGGTATGPASSSPQTDAALALEQKRQQIRALEADRQRELDAVQQQLATAQLTLTPLHPTVVGLKQKLDALALPSPELNQLKTDERALMSQIAAAPVASAAPAPAAKVAGPAVDPGQASATPAQAAAPAGGGGGDNREDPATALTRSKLEEAIKRYQGIEERVDAASVERDIARTAFKYRYTVLAPAEVPNKPKKPMAKVLGVAALPIAALLALLIAAAADLAGGRILETWQIRRKLKLEVLGELELPG